jgi:hypothetical protein
MIQGDDLWIFGYPGAGQDPRKRGSLPTMNVSEGKFAGVVNEQDTETRHHISWVKTDAEISGGNSGGCSTDDEGNYRGSPNEVHTDVRDTRDGDGGALGHVGFIRPTNLFKPYVDLAANGWVPSDAGADHAAQPAQAAQASGEGVVVTGRVASADTGEPVAGIIIVVFKDGVTAKQALAAKNPATCSSRTADRTPTGSSRWRPRSPGDLHRVRDRPGLQADPRGRRARHRRQDPGDLPGVDQARHHALHVRHRLRRLS